MKDSRVQVWLLLPDGRVMGLEVYARLENALRRWRRYRREQMPQWQLDRHLGRLFIGAAGQPPPIRRGVRR